MRANQAETDDDPRFWFWAVFRGGIRERPYLVEFGPQCHGAGFYTRHEGDSAITLLRYDRHSGSHRGGARLGEEGHWHTDECPDRNVLKGSDYGEPVTPEQAGQIVESMGYAREVIYRAAVPDE